MTSNTADTQGRVAYEAYGRSTGHRTHDDRPMPAWDDLGETVQRAWAASAAAVGAVHGQPVGSTRAKFRCLNETRTRYSSDDSGQRTYNFSALYDPAQPDDQRYAKATPAGELKITVDNPAVQFQPGTAYYLDITRASS
jgi:hypothetical protein